MTYPMTIAGLRRELPLCKVADDFYIGAFIMFGDAEITVACAKELLARAPKEYDYLLTAEAKSIPLIHEMARQSGASEYFVARKGMKVYLTNPIHVQVHSITTQHDQDLYLSGEDAAKMKGKKVLTGAIQGVERAGDNPNLIYAVVYHGNFKVIIPSLEAVEEPEDYRDQPKSDVLHYLLNKRLGAEVDYIVKGIDQETGVAVASRLEAMAQKRKEYYFKTDRDGNYQLYEGVCAEARVVSVIRAGVFVDLFGAECYVPLKELSYQRWIDASAHYQPGQRVLVKILEVDRSDRSKPRVLVSVKQAGENPYEQALKRFTVGSRYVGTVSLVDLTGVFVALDGGIDCLCTYPKRGRPPRGARVTVRILGIDHETNRIWGVITHMSTLR